MWVLSSLKYVSKHSISRAKQNWRERLEDDQEDSNREYVNPSWGQVKRQYIHLRLTWTLCSRNTEIFSIKRKIITQALWLYRSQHLVLPLTSFWKSHFGKEKTPVIFFGGGMYATCMIQKVCHHCFCKSCPRRNVLIGRRWDGQRRRWDDNAPDTVPRTQFTYEAS